MRRDHRGGPVSAPALLGCAAAALCLGLPVAAAATHLEASHRAAAAADSAALAAADAASGWIAGDPCTLAHAAAEAHGAEIVSCEVDLPAADARVTARVAEIPGARVASAHAAGAGLGARAGPVAANGWAWPSSARGVTQGFHDGLAIDLAVSADGALFAPYDGTVVASGPDGAGIPTACTLSPGWWRGPNVTVMMRHEYEGRVLYSSHNHVAPGSPERAGVTAGSRVRAGQQVASAGMSGCTSGPHTHFTLSTHPGNAFPDLNPYDYLGEP